LGNNEIETVTLAGNHQFRYLTGKHKMLNVTIKCQQTRAANATVTADVQNDCRQIKHKYSLTIRVLNFVKLLNTC